MAPKDKNKSRKKVNGDAVKKSTKPADSARKAEKKVLVSPDANWKALLSKGTVGDKPTAAKRKQQKRERPGSSSSSSKSSIDWTRKLTTSKDTRMVALDCEMVGVGVKNESRLARVCVINERGEVMLDKYSKPMEAITDYRTQWSGIRPSDLVNAPSFWDVQVEVADLVRGKMLVGHSLKSDLEVLMLKHPRSLIRDTAMYAPLRRVNPNTGRRHAAKLRDLCLQELGKVIQDGEHDPYVDARAALEVYKKHASDWEKRILDMRASRRLIRDKKRSRGVPDDEGETKIVDMTTSSLKRPRSESVNSEGKSSQSGKSSSNDVFSNRTRPRKHKRA